MLTFFCFCHLDLANAKVRQKNELIIEIEQLFSKIVHIPLQIQKFFILLQENMPKI